MTLVAAGPLYVPDINYFNAKFPTFTGTLLDAAADRFAAVFRAPKTGNLRKIEVRFGAVPVLTTSDLTIGLQDVSLTTGDPDGTFDQSATIATGSIVANTTVKATLGADRAVTRGELLAVVVQFGTFASGDSLNINWMQQGASGGPYYFSYVVVNSTGAYAKFNSAQACFSIEYDDGSYAFSPSLLPVIVGSADAFNNTSTPDEIGLRFQVPMPCRIGGCHVNIDADGDFNIVLYTAAGRTVLASVDKDTRNVTGQAASPIWFTDEVTLAANTTYVLAVEPSSATSVILAFYDVSSAAVLDQLSGGQAFHYATAKNPSTTADFTMTTTRRPVMGLILTAVDDGTGSGGGGGIRLAGHGGLAA